MKLQQLAPVIIIVFGLLCSALLFHNRPQPSASTDLDNLAPVKVQVVSVAPAAKTLLVSAHGVVHPKREIDLIAQVSGEITQVDAGFLVSGYFEKSQTLLRVDDRDYQIEVIRAESRLASARQQLAEERGKGSQAVREWQDLGNENANALFLRKPQLAAAEAGLLSAEAELRQARLNLSRTRITMPFTGYIKEIHADLGQFISRGTRIATIYSSTHYEVRLPLSEKQSSLLELPLRAAALNHTAVEARSAHSVATATLDPSTSRTRHRSSAVRLRGSVASRNYEWEGRLNRIEPYIDSRTHTYNAIVDVIANDPDNPLLPGLFVEAEITGKTLENVIVVPDEAVFQQNKVFVLGNNNEISVVTAHVHYRSESHAWLSLEKFTKSDRLWVSIEKHALTPGGSIVDPVPLPDKIPFSNNKEYAAYDQDR